VKTPVRNGVCSLRCAQNCPVCRSDPKWREFMGTPEDCPHSFNLGNLVASIATPIARVLKLSCIDPATQELRPESKCAKRKAALNKLL
jgi:hypothetical protein